MASTPNFDRITLIYFNDKNISHANFKKDLNIFDLLVKPKYFQGRGSEKKYNIHV